MEMLAVEKLIKARFQKSDKKSYFCQMKLRKRSK